VLLVCLIAAPALGQEPDPQPPDHQHMNMEASGWSWSADGNVFAGYNYQQRKFADVWAFESQNWGMLAGTHKAGAGALTIHGMLSLEPATIAPLGSPQVFQTGESYQGQPLINLQHPHDFLMDLGVTYRIPSHGVTYMFEADLAGAPALGPVAYMHRESARDNPQAPLGHHEMDSTHVSAGVITGGVQIGHVTFEASTFRGEEPSDDNRWNIETPRLDSWSARAGWRDGPWSAQVSGGYLHDPEWFEGVNVTRLTASAGFDGAVHSRPLAVTVVWGQNREYNFALNALLAEWDWRIAGPSTLYGRAESTDKEIFDLGFHPLGLINPKISHVDALTVGYLFDIPRLTRSRWGIGADITVYAISADLIEAYGSPHSYHVFLRWRPTRTSSGHMH
jgi:hypothetical protein